MNVDTNSPVSEDVWPQDDAQPQPSIRHQYQQPAAIQAPLKSISSTDKTPSLKQGQLKGYNSTMDTAGSHPLGTTRMSPPTLGHNNRWQDDFLQVLHPQPLHHTVPQPRTSPLENQVQLTDTELLGTAVPLPLGERLPSSPSTECSCDSPSSTQCTTHPKIRQFLGYFSLSSQPSSPAVLTTAVCPGICNNPEPFQHPAEAVNTGQQKSFKLHSSAIISDSDPSKDVQLPSRQDVDGGTVAQGSHVPQLRQRHIQGGGSSDGGECPLLPGYLLGAASLQSRLAPRDQPPQQGQ